MFKPGDMVQIVADPGADHTRDPAHLIGKVSVVLSGPHIATPPGQDNLDHAAIVYELALVAGMPQPPAGKFFGVESRFLRLIDGDSDNVNEKTSWEDGEWRPKELVTIQ